MVKRRLLMDKFLKEGDEGSVFLENGELVIGVD